MMNDEKDDASANEKPDEIMDQAKRLLKERNSSDAFFNFGQMIGSFVLGMSKAGCNAEQIRNALPFIQNYLTTMASKKESDKKE